MCRDTGWEQVQTVWHGNRYTQNKPCACRLEKLRQKRLALIPPKFRALSLSDVSGDETRHSGQPAAVERIKQHPQSSFFLAGRFGTGKTMLAWMLYRAAVMRDAGGVVACTLSELLDEYRAAIQASMNNSAPMFPRIEAAALRQTHTRYTIFFDDIDKAKPSEYAAEQFYELTDAIYAYNHQVIVTTNLTVDRLVAHFDRADERFGGAIVRRLVSEAEIIEMF